MRSQDQFVREIRKDFPVLDQETNGWPLIYFDNAATSQKPMTVIESMRNYYESFNANVHRSVHTLGARATLEYEGARDKVAHFIKAPSRDTIIFTKNATEAINLVAYSWGRKNLERNDDIILTTMEHHSNIIPWQLLAREKEVNLRYLDFEPDGTLNLDHLKKLITSKTKLLAITHMSNVLGTINPVGEMVQLAHKHGIPVLVDGAQSAPHLPIDVNQLGCDFFAFSGHKMLGPTGIGVLFGRRELLEAMEPFLGGGEMISKVSWSYSTWNDLPWKFEAGTPPIMEAIALGTAIDYLKNLTMEKVASLETNLIQYALENIRKVDGIEIYGPDSASLRGGIIAFNLSQIHPHDLATFLDQRGIALRAGHHCAQLLHQRLGVPATTRLSFYIYNTSDEIDRFLLALEEASEFFRYDAK
ncbi:MAG: cysteine desulfurase [Candidatus Tectomicrobia bacterium]|uniref:Cysteine desulfurase n=1 Tax=Tectimicrobiota bacterium TaxID=2528274 RepID=A0A933LR57_UNCTE|nr:cysteine desulfurase [Candidatus Tectomicrobia bacterium]